MSAAIKSGRLQEFIAQEEARGIGPVDRAELDRRIADLIKAKQLEDRTLHSASAGGSTEKRTRQGTGRHISR
jgi:hypothetical protein